MNPPPACDRFTAQRLHKTGQRAGPLALYERILGDHPDHAPTLHMLANAKGSGVFDGPCTYQRLPTALRWPNVTPPAEPRLWAEKITSPEATSG